ncbi:NADH-FMN oxidoreductase RutF, flavin reductase (DIM6/NTAB) family [Roseovarius azorensis]|uniref:NADH-FMN oxidoreductase RutF, flavin reductase (DIM6/NTAB) family n=1 Tax=Roseovarius azorensis TaxID=1287727 RepID=A0A1H7KLD2_9RHOB|nr:flavin reductase family protein [Roseovarius azorensis]SEK86747.1 NADH-FMN oxidoreductase RutF, flavin reductase (DIM6/NTAB) family [Roseovarius azorensis]
MTTIDPIDLRKAFGRFMTGVTVVTARAEDGAPVGFTANSFSSVSLDPPMLLVCPGRFLSSHGVFETCRHFAVSVLAEGQEDVSNTFAGFKGDRFARVAYRDDCHGVPVIRGAVAQFSCRTAQVILAGDHSILIGEVARMSDNGGRGLGYAEGRYFSRGLEQVAVTGPGTVRIAGAIVECDGDVILEQTPDGLRPPQVEVPGRVGLREALVAKLAGRGLTVCPDRVYSIFDDGRTGADYAYFLAGGALDHGAGAFRRFRADQLVVQTYTSAAIATMMARYARETRHRRFGLYLGDERSGEVHDFQHQGS